MLRHDGPAGKTLHSAERGFELPTCEADGKA